MFQTPIFTPPEGIYQTAQNIAVAATIPSDATIRYTMDGTEPTSSSSFYTGPIKLPLNSTTTLKVKAFKTNWTASATQTATYTITGQASIQTPCSVPRRHISDGTKREHQQYNYTNRGADPLHSGRQRAD